jgi:hypothetical protein
MTNSPFEIERGHKARAYISRHKDKRETYNAAFFVSLCPMQSFASFPNFYDISFMRFGIRNASIRVELAASF